MCKKLAEKYGKEVPTAADEEEQEELQNEYCREYQYLYSMVLL